MEKAVALDRTDPTRDELLEIVKKIIIQCPKETRGHGANLAGSPLPPESEAIPRFFRNNPEATDHLEQLGALTPILREFF